MKKNRILPSHPLYNDRYWINFKSSRVKHNLNALIKKFRTSYLIQMKTSESVEIIQKPRLFYTFITIQGFRV